ncbi:MAG: hypothetical protein J5449_06935, partial [Oscillospiraceae bacterium]|nr:hypothetical protein [Oscillospiraceae bacterium]
APARAELPEGYWKYLSAYIEAVESGDEDAIIEAGNAYLEFLSGFERNREIAENQYNVYNRCLEMEIYERRGDWENAVRNTEGLLDASEYLNGIGVDRADMVRRCRIHLEVLRPHAGVYALSQTQRTTFGSTVAAVSGAYYGSIYDGRYAKGSICSFYVELESETARQFGYLIEPKADGKRVILINLNFSGEGATVRAIPSGRYDNNLRETLRYAATLKSPVLLRIGGEMDLWSEPGEFKTAYCYIASLARSLAPKAELVWSPNFVSGWGVNVEDYYPSDDKVDWVGVSLYFNYDANKGNDDPAWIEYTRAGRFADPLSAAERVLSIADSHNKPAIVTEGGVNRANGESYAATKAAKAFSTLTMEYPRIKAIVYFDKNLRGDYKLTGAAATAADRAVEENPTLIKSGDSSAGTYVPLERFAEAVNGGSVLLGATARNYRCTDMGVVWLLDGTQAAATPGSPNHFRLPVSTLAQGKHKLEAVFDDGQGGGERLIYTLEWDGSTLRCASGYTEPEPEPKPEPEPEQPTIPAEGIAYESRQEIELDGKKIVLAAYQIRFPSGGAANYVRIRDLAQVLDGTGAQFDIEWVSRAKTINIVPHHSYDHPNGSEGSVPFGGEQNYTVFKGVTLVNGAEVELAAFNISYLGGGNTYFLLRDIGRALDFNVGWASGRGVFIETDKPYTDAD